ncbi:MAG: TonB-dependent receptor [Chitinophagales bacterium]|nr:TonB-dependent receptor [Chitinophagales bacterium]
MSIKFQWSLFGFLIIMKGAFCQQASVITVLSDSDIAVQNAVIILKSGNKDAAKKQEMFFTNSKGQFLNTYPYPASIFIQCFGYQSYQGQVEPDEPYTFHLFKLVIDLNDVVVTGQYDINTSDKSVYNIKVFDQKIIRSMAAQNLSDLLSNQLEMRLSQDNLLGSNVSIDGISGQNIKILMDGVPVIGRENGNIDLSQLNLNNIERVEVVEGPMSVIYGTDALGGVINLVTRKASSYPLEADINFQYESVATYNADGAIFLRKSNNSLALSGGRYFFGGFSQQDTSRYKEWKPKLQYFGSADYNYNTAKFKLGIKTAYYNEEIQNKGAPLISPYQAYAFDDYYFTRRLDETVDAEYRFSNNSKIQFLNAYSNYRRIKNTYREDLVSLNEFLITDAGSQDTTVFNSLNFRGTYSDNISSQRLNFQTGYDINIQSGNGTHLKNKSQNINDYALFGSIEYKVTSDFTVRPGLRATYNSRYGAPVTPSLNIKYDILDRYLLRASYARGFRAPSLKELALYFVDVNHNIVGNNALKAETSNDFNLSFTVKNLLHEKDLLLKFDASFFFNDIKNVIALAVTDSAINQYSYINIGRYKSTGAVFTANFRLKNFSLTSGFSLLGFYDTLSSKYNVSRYSLSPEFQSNFTFSIPKPELEIALFLKSTGNTPGFNVDNKGNVYQTYIQSYTIADVSFIKYFWTKRVTLSAGIKNIFNVIDIQTNTANGNFHSAGGDTIPYGLGRFLFMSMRIKLFKEA